MTALAYVNNFISYSMLCADLEHRGIPAGETTLILGRQLTVDTHRFRSVLAYPSVPIRTGPRLWRLSGFYRRAARLVRSSLDNPDLRYAYVVNVDNILTNHVVNAARSSEIEVSVLIEGLLNYSDAGEHTLDPRRQLLKILAAQALGFRYVQPVGHVSGAYDPGVQRVVAFSHRGLRAPEHRVVVRRWPHSVAPEMVLERDTALLVQTGLGSRMTRDDYRRFVGGLVSWLDEQGFTRLLTKRHPRFPDPYLESQLPPHEVVADSRPLEIAITDLRAGVVIGCGTTPLATLKLMNPAFRCVDFGADYYAPRLYNGKSGPSELFNALDVEAISFLD